MIPQNYEFLNNKQPSEQICVIRLTGKTLFARFSATSRTKIGHNGSQTAKKEFIKVLEFIFNQSTLITTRGESGHGPATLTKRERRPALGRRSYYHIDLEISCWSNHQSQCC
jgi:hypothetical protein